MTVPHPGSLDALLPDDEPHGTFHDALISSIEVDYVACRWVARVQVCVGDPEADDVRARERRRDGELVIDGVQFWTIEPPGPGADGSPGLWLADDGVLADAPTERGKALARALRPGAAGWFLFFQNLNAFAYVAGERAEFRWSRGGA